MELQFLTYIYLAIYLIFYLIVGVVMLSKPNAGLFFLTSLFWFIALAYQIWFGFYTGLVAFAYLGMFQVGVSLIVFLVSLVKKENNDN
jgi:hypothetical protein